MFGQFTHNLSENHEIDRFLSLALSYHLYHVKKSSNKDTNATNVNGLTRAAGGRQTLIWARPSPNLFRNEYL